ncbi:fasciclin-like arabinogalactan protein 11 isoform X1 [Rhodamnia argentea]|uniref:Fasciclin-like arabinogalactan protein 11 isoform X1 n=1 Tax=Rhodamnia argentea TaxID=178133 RepID=A0A8B8NXZ4_9MYRT|nr:fasciclin-like arabinogalactan protein 11 isoform X1 [Rhodamnia argentea]
MKHQFIVLSLLFLIYATPTSAQPAASPAPPPSLPTPSPVSPPPDSPPPPAPPPVAQASILKILVKSGGFTVLVKLLRSTHVADQVDSQLADLNDGITFFAPVDAAFSALKAGTLNSLSDEQQVQLLQFHVVPTYLSMSQFQTVSNPLMTKAGGTGGKEFPLNVTSVGDRVSVFTGVNRASVTKTLYTDGKLAVYQVDKVLLPLSIFSAGSDFAQAPAPPRKKPVELAVSGSSEVGKVKTGDVVRLVIGIGVAGVVASLGL